MSDLHTTNDAAVADPAASLAVSRATDILQAILLACVVLWVLDVPRQVFGMSFYTEQLLAVTLGLTLALAFITEAAHKPGAIDLGGAITVLTIAVYLIYHYAHDGVVAWPAVAGVVAALLWTFFANRVEVARWLDWICAAASLGALRLYHRPLRGADL